jgi:hypothetical protein
MDTWRLTSGEPIPNTAGDRPMARTDALGWVQMAPGCLPVRLVVAPILESFAQKYYFIGCTSAIPRRSRRGYAPSLWETYHHSNTCPSFQRLRLSDRPPYAFVGIGRNGADSEPAFGGGLSARVTRQYPKGRSVNAHSRRVCLCRLLKTRTTIPPTLPTPAGVPVAKTTPGHHIRSRIGVPATWHGQQSTSPMPWDYPRPKGLVVRCLDCEPETPTARDSSA